MNVDLISSKIYWNYIVAHDIRWKIDGKMQEPTIEDVQLLTEQMLQDASTSNTTTQCGGICMINNDGKIDIYIRLYGEE